MLQARVRTLAGRWVPNYPRLSRILGLIGIVTLMLACGDGVSGPQPAPPAVRLDPLPSVTNQPTLDVSGQVTGSGAENADIEITGGASTAEGTADDRGYFSINVSLKRNQENVLSVVAIRADGARSDPKTHTILHDEVAPGAPVLATPEFTNQSPLAVTGTAEPGSTVRVEREAESAEGTAGSSGQFAINISLAANASNTITAKARDAAGNEGPPATATVTHDDLVPTLNIDSPTSSSFDSDGDLRVNIALGYSETGLSGIDVGTLEVTNNRDIGGGAVKGGVDAGTNLAEFFDSVTETAASYNARLDHEFPAGSNTLTVEISDRAGNTATQSVAFSVAGTDPAFQITSPDEGAQPAPQFLIRAEYEDVAGLIDVESFELTADRTVFGLLLQDGTKFSDVPAGTNLRDLFSITDTDASFDVDSTRYAFPEGASTLVGTISDRAGNTAPSDAVTFNAAPRISNLLVILTSTDPGTTEHVVPVGLTNLSDLGGVNFVLNFDPTVLAVDSVKTTGRVAFPADSNADTQGSSGAVTTIVFDIDGDPIPAGAGVVLDFYVTIAGSAASGSSAITLTDLAASDSLGAAVPIVGTDGFITIN